MDAVPEAAFPAISGTQQDRADGPQFRGAAAGPQFHPAAAIRSGEILPGLGVCNAADFSADGRR